MSSCIFYVYICNSKYSKYSKSNMLTFCHMVIKLCDICNAFTRGVFIFVVLFSSSSYIYKMKIEK